MTVNEHSTMSEAECWDFLRSQRLGRLAYHLVDEVHIVPINYRIVDDKILLRTVPGSKLVGITMNADVAFEADEIDGDKARSVVARGQARELEGDEKREAEELRIDHTLGEDARYRDILIEVSEISGQTFELPKSA